MQEELVVNRRSRLDQGWGLKRFTHARPHCWLDGFAFGLFVAAIFVCLFFWLVQADLHGRYDEYFIALLTATGAIGAAFLAVLGIGAQIRHASELDDRRREDAWSASLAMLPLALGELSEASLSNVRRHFDPDDLFPCAPHKDELEPFSLSALNVLKSCIQHADSKSREEMVYVIRAYQVLSARDSHVNKGRKIEKRPAGNMAEFGRIGDAVSWAALHATIDNLFEYARGGGAVVRPFTSHAAWSSLLVAGLLSDEFPNVESILEKKIEKGDLRLRFAPA